MLDVIINGWVFHDVSIYYQRDLLRAVQDYNYITPKYQQWKVSHS